MFIIRRAIREAGCDAFISIDTRKAAVAEAAIQAGADIINDVSAATFDPAMLPLLGRLQVPYIAMHMRGDPSTMLSPEHTRYSDVEGVAGEVTRELKERLDAIDAVLPRWLQIIDPGIGFAKGYEQNMALLQPKVLRTLKQQLADRPLLIGLSRKRFLGRILEETLSARSATVQPTAAAAAAADVEHRKALEQAKEVASSLMLQLRESQRVQHDLRQRCEALEHRLEQVLHSAACATTNTSNTPASNSASAAATPAPARDPSGRRAHDQNVSAPPTESRFSECSPATAMSRPTRSFSGVDSFIDVGQRQQLAEAEVEAEEGDGEGVYHAGAEGEEESLLMETLPAQSEHRSGNFDGDSVSEMLLLASSSRDEQAAQWGGAAAKTGAAAPAATAAASPGQGAASAPVRVPTALATASAGAMTAAASGKGAKQGIGRVPKVRARNMTSPIASCHRHRSAPAAAAAAALIAAVH